MMKLARMNFKSSFKNYLAVILSLAFTILVFLNFQNIIYSDIFDGLEGKNKEYIEIIIQIISFVLGCFMFFFLWYATNVFLTKRKKEIGIYIFMGLTNQKIGHLYIIENVMIGISAFVLGIGFGILTTQLFQMILLAISDITVDISFTVAVKPILITAAVYLILYMVFAVKGYVNIVRSSVLDMVSASRQNEYVKQKSSVLMMKAILGMIVSGSGYYFAVKEGGQEVMENVMAAAVLVVVGTYLLFGGLIPLIFQNLAKRKLFLYKKERTLWMNQVIFRMKKNYRTYAMTCVLMICSVTALATGFAMKMRYDAMNHFRNTYTYQFMSSKEELDETIRPLIEKDNKVIYSGEISMLMLDASLVETRYLEGGYGVLPYSQLKELAERVGLEFDLREPNDDEIIKASHLYILSLITDRSKETVTIHGKTYQQIEDTNIPYMGYFQEMMSFYVVNDREYENLKPLGEEMRTYHYGIEDMYNFAASRDELDTLNDIVGDERIARVIRDPQSSDMEWIKVLYTVCIFMFMVFILASGSILFMKLYNDAFEEKERIFVLRKLGISGKTLKKSLSHELKTAYALPFLVMMVSSYFSVHALEKMMYQNLFLIYLASVGVIFAVFLLYYLCSVSVYVKNAKAE